MKNNLFIILFLLSGIFSVLRSQVCFVGTDYATGATMQAVDSADFNNDGFTDIVTCSHGPTSTVNIFFNDGLGNFTAGPVISGFSAPPRYVATGDIDGDNDMDIMVGHNNSNGYSKLFNTGGGSFSAPNFVICTQATHIMINAGDLDADGDIDFVYATVPYIVILKNSGSGVFTETTIGKSYDAYGVAAGDLNNDGKTDLITMAHSDSIGVLVNTNTVSGTLSFAASVSYYKGTSGVFDLRFITCRDLNNDGYDDVIASNKSSNTVSVFLNDGAGSLLAPAVLNAGGQMYNSSVADFDLDGNVDFVVSSTSPSFYKIYYGDGTGAFPASTIYTTNVGFAGLVTADFNADSKPDIATAGGSSDALATVYLNSVQRLQPLALTPVTYCQNAFASPLSATGSNLLWYTTSTGGVGNTTAPVPSTSVAGTMDYYVSQGPADACESTRDTITVTIFPAPSSTFTSSNFCENTLQNIPFNFSGGTPPYTFNWYPLSGSSFSTTQPFASVVTTAPNSYTVDVIDANGCMSSNVTGYSITASTDLYGVISSSTLGLMSPANVYLFEYLPSNSGFDTIALVPTNASGEYVFPSLTAGWYLIKAVADTQAYQTAVPTYYGNTFQWDSSIVFSHSCTQTDTANIAVIELAGGSGPGYISGYIIEAAGFGQRIMIPQYDPFMVPGGPLKGIDVKLGKNPSGGIQARTMTDSTGKYEFTNLPLQGYRIYVDIPNLPMDSLREVTLTAGNEISIENNYFADSVHIYINSTTVSLNGTNTSAVNAVVFPNPVTDKIYVRIETAPGGDFYSELCDLTGKKVLVTSRQKLDSGSNTICIDLASGKINKGIYILTNYINNNRHTCKVVITE